MFRWGDGGRLVPPPFLIRMASSKFPAVTIEMGTRRCPAVETLEGMRILATHAPKLPMTNCSMAATCRCRFKKYVDRREDEEGRRFKFGAERSAWYTGGQRRKSKGRRIKD
jgi:hypothetical protein